MPRERDEAARSPPIPGGGGALASIPFSIPSAPRPLLPRVLVILVLLMDDEEKGGAAHVKDTKEHVQYLRKSRGNVRRWLSRNTRTRLMVVCAVPWSCLLFPGHRGIFMVYMFLPFISFTLGKVSRDDLVVSFGVHHRQNP